MGMAEKRLHPSSKAEMSICQPIMVIMPTTQFLSHKDTTFRAVATCKANE